MELVELVFRSYKALSESAPSGMMPPVTVPGLTNQQSSNYTLAPSPNMGSPVAAAAGGGPKHLGRERGEEQEREGREENKEHKENVVSKHGGNHVGVEGQSGGGRDEVLESAGGRSGAAQGSDSDSPAAPAVAPAVALFTLLFDCDREEVQEALREHLRVSECMCGRGMGDVG